MRGVIRALGGLLLLGLAACASEPPATSVGGDGDIAFLQTPISCVPYARAVSGIDIRGDAWTWWGQADGRYLRGRLPRAGAVLVFTRTKRLPHGHVSVVTRVVNAREILVTHANWGSTRGTRGRVTRDVRILDISPGNDWSRIKVWNLEIDDFGLPYAAQGFIYPVTGTMTTASGI
jgi:hypothetical protein